MDDTQIMRQGKPLSKFLTPLILAGLLLGLANLPGKSEAVAASDLAQLIEEQAEETVEVTVNGQQYYIVTLENYIEPGTLELSSSDSVVKVYVDAEWEPISNPNIVQKVGRIDFARRFQNIVGSPDDISRIIENMQDRLYYHRIIRFCEVLADAHAKAMAVAIRGYITGLEPISVVEDAISAVEDITSSFIRDPKNLLAAVVYEDFSDAEENYNQAKEIAERGDIIDYDTAYDYLNYFFTGDMYQYPAFHLLDKIDEIDKSLTDEFRDFAIQVADEILGGYYGNVKELLGDLEAISWVIAYCRERSEAEARTQEVLSMSNWASRYTFALSSGVGSAEDTTTPETYITQAPEGIATSGDVAFSWLGSDDITPTSELVYSYYLSDFDSSWSTWTSNTSKQYTGLPTGDYLFKVIAKDQAGNIDPSPAEVSLSTGIAVEDADSVQKFSMVPSEGLLTVASEVTPRVIVEYANSIQHQNLIPLPSQLVSKVSEVSPRAIIEYANSNYHRNLKSLPSALLDVASNVTSRIVVEYVNSIYCHDLEEIPHQFPSFTAVSVFPESQDVACGEPFIVELVIDPEVAIAGIQFDFSFDSSLIIAVSVEEGNLLNQSGASTYFSPGTIDNGLGTITGIAGSITMAGETVSSPGVFAIINFTAKDAQGTSPLDLSNVIVGDINGDPVLIIVSGGNVTIGKTGDVNSDDHVNVLDMVLIGQHWGQTGSPGWIPEDVKKDGAINVLDMIIIGQHWTG